MRKNRFDFTFRCLLALVFTVALAGHASAQRYWSGFGSNPATAGTGIWDNVNTQWSINFPAYTPATWNSDIANFNGTGGGTVTLVQNIIVNDINFGANAGGFNLDNAVASQIFRILGAGITNNSANNQAINNSGLNGQIEFHNSATAGNVIITHSGVGARTTFFDSSTAGNATINNSGMNSETTFNGANTTAGNATINNLGMFVTTNFNNGATAGSATMTNDTSTSTIRFNGGNASAGNAIINNNGTGGNSFVEFNGATGANVIINNNGAGARVQFESTTTAANATITNNGAGSILLFTQTGSGGNSTLINNNATAEIDLSFLSTAGTTAGSIAGNGFINLSSKNFAVGGNNTNTTFSGVMRDGGQAGGVGGSLTKVGTGRLILSGSNTYTGSTTISGGVLQVDGAIVSSTTVDAGGTLAGSGLINAGVSNNGIVSPGSPGTEPGTLSVTGAYQQATTATLRIDIGGLAPGQHDLLAIGSSVDLAGTLQLVRLNNFTPTNGDQVIIMTHLGINNSGQFSSITDNFTGLIRPQVFYDTSDVRVVFALINSFASQALTPNQKSVAHNLDDAANDPAAAALIGFLGTEPMGNLPHDFDLIAPEELAAIYEISISSSMVQNNNLQRRMDDIRAGSNGFCANGFTPQVSGKDVSKDSGGKMVLDQKQGPDVYTPSENNRWGVFINGTGDFVNVGDGDSNAPGYDITTGEFTLGVDYRLCDNFAIGVNGGYSSSRANLVDAGRIETDGGKMGAYATWFGKGFFGSKFYVDGVVGGGLNNYDTRRTGLQNILVSGDTDGTEFNAMISYGSDWTFGCFNIGTWSSVQFTNVNIDEFTETGSLAPLVIEDQDENSFRATTGVHASYDIKAGHVLIRPEVRAAYQHEYCDSAYQIDSQLASGAGGISRVRGPRIGRDSALVDAGVNVQWSNRFSTYVYYDGVLGRNNYDNNAVSGGLRFGF